MLMLNAKEFFFERLKAHVKELNRYLRYILTGHLAIAMFFIFSAMAVYYQKWLEELPENFPVAIVIAVLLGFFTMYSPIQTLLKKADVVFLIPAEQKLASYFTRTLIYSYLTQIYLVLFVYAVMAPLYFASFSDGSLYFFLLFLLLLIKAWSILANWWMLKIRERSSRVIDQLVRLLLIIAIVYFFLERETMYLFMVTAILVGLFLYNYLLAKKQPGIQWDLLIERDYLRMRSFYRLANMFTDVPHLETTVKKRHGLARLLTSSIPHKQHNSYTFLFRLTTARSGEYFGIYIRLLVIGCLLVYYVPNPWLKLIFAILFGYMTFIQLMPLWKHHSTLVWLDLYPITEKVREASFIKWLKQLMIIQLVIFAVFLFFVGNLELGLFMFIFSILFIQFVIPAYVHKKLKG